MDSRTSLRGATLALALGCAGCEAVPDIHFGDASTDAAKIDGSKPDAAVDSGKCTLPIPAGATCCGTVWCVDQCDTKNCDECATKGCSAAELCCGKQGTVQCKDKCP